jgi:KDO2-lipid IV(A) lauroyltransferase
VAKNARRSIEPPDSKTRLAFFVASALGRFSKLFPTSIGYWLSDRCGDLTWALSPGYRVNVRANLSHAMDLPDSHREVRRLTRKVFQYSARNFFDLMRVALITDDELRAAVYGSKESWDRLEAARVAGKGGIIASAHFGAFDYTGQSIFTHGYPIIPLTTRTVPAFIYRVVTLLRKSHGLTIEEATPSGIRHILAAIRRGEFAGLLADRDFFQNGIEVEFFGEKTTLPPGPARIARDTGAPILAAFTKRLSKGYILTVDEPFFVQRSEDPQRDIQEAMQRVVTIFERQIRESPEQWVMFQRVWPQIRSQPVAQSEPSAAIALTATDQMHNP